jgi:uncharacterized delta-60 repeat protein
MGIMVAGYLSLRGRCRDTLLSIGRGLWVSGIVSAALASTSVCAQVGGRDPTFLPGQILNGSTAATVYAVTQTSSGLIIAGDFTSVSGVGRGRIARLNASGDLDTTFASGQGANGAIRAMLVQTDGKIVVGGDFTEFDGTARNRLARLNSNGTLDTSFNPGAGLNGTVHCMAVSVSDRRIIVGGEFTTANNVSRNGIAKFDVDTGAHYTSFNPGTGANGPVYAVLSDPYSYYRIYVGGDFTTFNGASRNRLARIDESGWLDSSFNIGTGFDGPVYAIAAETNRFSSSGGILVGGDFNVFNGSVRTKLARLNAGWWYSSALLDPYFKVVLDGAVRSIAVSSASSWSIRVLVAGDFQNADGVTRSRVARLNVSSGSFVGSNSGAMADLDASFNQSQQIDGSLRSVLFLNDTRVIIAGGITNVGGSPSGPVSRLYGDYGGSVPTAPTMLSSQTLSTSQVALEWSGATNAHGYSIEASSDDGASWSSVATASGSPHIVTNLIPATSYLFRLFSSNYNGNSPSTDPVTAITAVSDWTGPGSADGIPAAPSSTVEAILRQPDGKIILAGSFTSIAGVTRNRIARLNADMTLDTSFNPSGGPNSTVNDIAIQADGKILIVGSFSQVGGVDREYVARLNTDGSLDSTFDVGIGPNSSVECVGIMPDGRILVGGWFSTFAGYSQDYIARLNIDGSLDLSFRTTASSIVYDIEVLPDGRFYLGGGFSTINGVSRSGLARVLPNGEVDSSFNPGSGGTSVYAISAAPNGHLVLGGSFSNFGNSGFKYVAKLDSSGAPDSSFFMAEPPNASVEAVAVDGAGRVLVGGGFTKLGSKLQFRIARLLGSGSVDPSFQVGAGANNVVYTILVQPDSRVLLGGAFTTLGQSQRNYFARVLGGDANDPLIVTDSLKSAVAGQSYSANIAAVGGLLPYTWEITFGALPQGLSLNADGSIAGVPIESVVSNFTIRLTDARGGSSEKLFSLLAEDTPSRLRVIEASYGAGSTYVDVSSYVSAGISSSSASMSVSNTAFGGDPVPGQVKTLYVTYQDRTGRYLISAREGTNLTFPNSTALKVPINFDVWRSTKFSSLQVYNQSISGAGADPDSDGASNLLESAFGGDPLLPDAMAVLPTHSSGGTGSQFRFFCDASRSDLTYVVEVTTDVADKNSWVPIAKSVAGAPVQSLRGDVSISDVGVGLRQATVVHQGSTSDKARFYRVSVQRP